MTDKDASCRVPLDSSHPVTYASRLRPTLRSRGVRAEPPLVVYGNRRRSGAVLVCTRRPKRHLAGVRVVH